MIKKRGIIGFLILAMLLPLFVFSPVENSTATDKYNVARVKLTMADSDTRTFTVAGNYYISESPTFPLVSGTCTITVIDGNLKITSDSNSLIVGPEITFKRYKGATSSSTYLTINNQKYGSTKYLGDMEFSIISGGYIRLINYIPVEDYLYGVVGYEMSDSFPMQALMAQAVCARGYVIAAMQGASSSATYDIGDTSSDQVYRGYNSSYTNVIAAVDATAGQVLTYSGKIITAYFSASNGGQTERYDNWAQSNGSSASNPPYYQNQDDPFDIANPSSMEELSFIPQNFTADTIADMDDLVYNKLLDGAKAQLPSATSVVLSETIAVTPNTRKYSYGTSNCYRYAAVDMIVLADTVATPITVTIDLDSLVYSSSNTSGIFSRSYNLRMRGAEVSTDASLDGWFLTNRRWGHGVGLSQRGAQQRAKSGQNYNDILAFYYVGTTLSTFDTAADALPNKPGVSGVPGKVTSTTLNVRQGPGTGFSVMGTVSKGQVVVIVYANFVSGWHQVYYDGQLGYVSSSGVSILPSSAYTLPGWINVDGNGYYLTSAGMLTTGIQVIDGAPYYFADNGILQRGFIISGTKLYYANASGVLQTGTVTIGGYTFTFDPTTYCTDASAVVALMSTAYQIDRTKEVVSNVPRETTVASFISGFVNGSIVRVVNKSGAVVTSGYVGTGMHVQTVLGGSVADDMEIILRADANGDGYIDVNDILEIQSYILGKQDLTYAKFTAADINGDQYADVNDILCIVDDIIGRKTITP